MDNVVTFISGDTWITSSYVFFRAMHGAVSVAHAHCMGEALAICLMMPVYGGYTVYVCVLPQCFILTSYNPNVATVMIMAGTEKPMGM